MFVYLPDRGRYAVLAALGALATGCTDPVQSTDLRPDGPPEVLAVMVMNDSINGLSEAATFCKANDDKRPSLVGLPDGSTQQVCPTDGKEVKDGVTDAAPQGWFVRVMFDELLDPSIEDLTEILDNDGNPTGTYSGSIARTHPFKITCAGLSGAQVDIPYDGYYSAAGNALTWPLGPSLVMKPNVPASVPTDSKCSITLNDNILDKNDGAQVPADQRGPYDFSIGKIKVVALSPSNGDEVDAIAAGADLIFNDLIDMTDIDDTMAWQWTPADKAQVVYSQGFAANGAVGPGAGTPTVGGRPVGAQEIFVGADFFASTEYTFAIPDGTKFTDLCGRATTFGPPSKDANTQVTFKTKDLKFSGLTPVDGTMVALPTSRIKMTFNQSMDPDTITGWTLKEAGTDVTATASVVIDGSVANVIDIIYPFKLDTDYVFDLPASNVRECPGAEPLFGGACDTSGMSISVPAQHTAFHTIKTMAQTTFAPATGSTFTKLTDDQGLNPAISVGFNALVAAAQPQIVQGTNFTITPNVALTVSGSAGSVRFRPTPAVPGDPTPAYAKGDYTFTLKAGTVVLANDGTMYTLPADLVTQFTVNDPEPAPDCIP